LQFLIKVKIFFGKKIYEDKKEEKKKGLTILIEIRKGRGEEKRKRLEGNTKSVYFEAYNGSSKPPREGLAN
jgi:hypothetical protein